MFEIWTKRVTAIKLSSMRSVSGFSRLPAEYQEVEYIESDWNAYINVWILAKNMVKINLVASDFVMWSSYADSNSIIVFWTTASSWWCSSTYYTYNWARLRYHMWISWWPHDDCNCPQSWTNNVIEYNWTTWFTVNGVAWTRVWTDPSRTNADNYPICFWYCWNNSHSKYKMYDLKITANDWEHIFVPCYRVLDWVIWLYDLANGQFYSNVWTWTFVKWRDILYGINSHTLRYYPFASNVADRAGQGATGTVNWTVSYSDNWIVISWDSGYVTWMTNWIANRDTYTQIFRARYTSFPDNYWLLIWDSSNYNTNSSFAFETWGDGSWYFRVYNFIGSWDVIWAGQDTPRDTYFHLWVITADHWSYKLYKDGELYLEWITTWTINNQPNMNLWRSSYYWSQREWYGEVKDYIVEDIPRSAQKIKDFYNMYMGRVYSFVNSDLVAYYPLDNDSKWKDMKNSFGVTTATTDNYDMNEWTYVNNGIWMDWMNYLRFVPSAPILANKNYSMLCFIKLNASRSNYQRIIWIDDWSSTSTMDSLLVKTGSTRFFYTNGDTDLGTDIPTWTRVLVGLTSAWASKNAFIIRPNSTLQKIPVTWNNGLGTIRLCLACYWFGASQPFDWIISNAAFIKKTMSDDDIMSYYNDLKDKYWL